VSVAYRRAVLHIQLAHISRFLIRARPEVVGRGTSGYRVCSAAELPELAFRAGIEPATSKYR
jgi:hypothetical protein